MLLRKRGTQLNTLPIPGERCPKALAVAFAWFGVTFAIGLPPPLKAQIAEWRLADLPVFEVGRDDGVWLHGVTDAVFSAGGVLLIADNGNNRVLRLSPEGEVVDSLGREGAGPGEFESVTRVFTAGDTALVYDVVQHRVTSWVSGQKPVVRQLPQWNGFHTVMRGVVSPGAWLLSTHETSFEGQTAFREVWTDVLSFDPVARTTTPLGRRHINYEYFVREQYGPENWGTTTYGMDFLGSAHLAAADGSWMFVPMDRAVVEVHAVNGLSSALVALPVELKPYSKEVWEPTRDRLLSGTSGRSKARAVRISEELWVEKFAVGAPAGEAEETEWIVTNPLRGDVGATVVVEPGVKLLGGAGELAVVVVHTDLDEEIVQVRKILRGET